MDGNNFAPFVQQWFRSLEPITRTWFVSTLLVTGLANLNFLDLKSLYLHRLSDVWMSHGKIEVWRLITCFLYAGKIGWGTLFGLHMMSQISSRYEAMGPICTRVRRREVAVNNEQNQLNDGNANQPVNTAATPRVEYYDRGETSDYAFALILGCLGILLSNFFLLPCIPSPLTYNQQYIFFHHHLTFFVLYIWSKQHPDHIVTLFGVQMTAAWLPYAYLVLGYAINNGQVLPLDMVHGMLVGHVYFHLACVVPKVLRGKLVIVTPMWLVNFCYWMEGRRFGDGGLANNNPMVVDVDGVIGG